MPAVSGGTTHSPFGSSTRRRKPSSGGGSTSHVSYTPSPTRVRRAVHSAAVIPATTSSAASPRSAPSTRNHSQAKQRKRQAAQKVRQIRREMAKGARTLPGLDTTQTQVAAKVLKQGVKAGASRKELLAAAETGLVESSFHNLPGGDGTSVGWRQETSSSYPDVNRMSVKGGAKRFFSETSAARIKGESAGTLAQSVQRSAYPSRYDEVKAQAKPIVQAYLHGQAPKSKQLPGAWEGARKAVHKIAGMPVGGGKRTPAENSAVGGATQSDHLTTSKNAYAKDLPYEQSILTRVSKNIGLKTPLKLGQDWNGTFHGYRIQIITHPHGTGPHIHIGAAWEAGATGTVAGAVGGLTSGAVASSGGGVPTGAGGPSTASARRRVHPMQRRRRKAARAIGRLRAQSDKPAPDYNFKLTSLRDTTPAREAHL